MKKVLLILLLLLTAGQVFAVGTCDLAQTVAQKAQTTFVKDQAAGLKLFIKAQQLCTGDARYSYNLGLAYYQYGRLEDAVMLLETAVAKDGANPLWLNNLASMLLQQGGKAKKALKYAEKAARKGSCQLLRNSSMPFLVPQPVLAIQRKSG